MSWRRRIERISKVMGPDDLVIQVADGIMAAVQAIESSKAEAEAKSRRSTAKRVKGGVKGMKKTLRESSAAKDRQLASPTTSKPP